VRHLRFDNNLQQGFDGSRQLGSVGERHGSNGSRQQGSNGIRQQKLDGDRGSNGALRLGFAGVSDGARYQGHQ